MFIKNKKSLRQRNLRLYQTWASMKYRCNTSTCPRYDDYGGRGIRVFDEWNKYENFYYWAIGNGYSDNLTIDRIDNDGDYEPNNCQWSTFEDQNKNRSIVLDVTINEETKKVREWCAIYGINYRTVITRYSTYGWDIVKAITTPVMRKNPAEYKEYEEEVRSRIAR